MSRDLATVRARLRELADDLEKQSAVLDRFGYHAPRLETAAGDRLHKYPEILLPKQSSKLHRARGIRTIKLTLLCQLQDIRLWVRRQAVALRDMIVTVIRVVRRVIFYRLW